MTITITTDARINSLSLAARVLARAAERLDSAALAGNDYKLPYEQEHDFDGYGIVSVEVFSWTLRNGSFVRS